MASEASAHQDDNNIITGKSPHFYKIILERTIRERKFGIPVKFVKKFGDFLTSPIILNVPSGKSWQVDLLKVGDEMWVANGWHEFSKHHSLKYGHLVLFKYEGGCHFNVHIFDMSAVEIKYPGSEIPSSVDPKHGGCFQHPKLQVNEDEDAISCEILDDTSNQSCEKDLNVSINESQGKLIDEKGATIGFDTCQALEADNNISSNYPSIKIVLRYPSFVNIPFSFVKRYMECKKQSMMLQAADKSWPVKLNVYPHKHIAILSGGWRAFSKEHSLKVGDACNFELIEGNVMIVSMFKRAR